MHFQDREYSGISQPTITRWDPQGDQGYTSLGSYTTEGQRAEPKQKLCQGKLTEVMEKTSDFERKRRRHEGGGRKGDDICPHAQNREVNRQNKQQRLSLPPSWCGSPETGCGSQPVEDRAVIYVKLYQRLFLLSFCLAPNSRFPKRVGDVTESATHPEQLLPPSISASPLVSPCCF